MKICLSIRKGIERGEYIRGSRRVAKGRGGVLWDIKPYLISTERVYNRPFKPLSLELVVRTFRINQKNDDIFYIINQIKEIMVPV